MLGLLTSPFIAQRAQKRPDQGGRAGNAVIWESVNVKKQDLFLGPGGASMQPNLSRITLISEEKGGYSKKYKIKDGSGSTWVAKIGLEAQSETAAVRIISAIGYKTDINYLVPRLTIPGKGTFSNVRLEARPDGVKRDGEWKWGDNPFDETREYRGLKIMMAFLNNWDMKKANNVILKKGNGLEYAISDLGATFGKMGSNSLPLFWRIGRSRNDPQGYSRTRFVKGTSNGKVNLVFNGKNSNQMHDITIADARWLADLLIQLTDRQIRDAFRAANYSQHDIDLLAKTVEYRIAEIDRSALGSSMAGGK